MRHGLAVRVPVIQTEALQLGAAEADGKRQIDRILDDFHGAREQVLAAEENAVASAEDRLSGIVQSQGHPKAR